MCVCEKNRSVTGPKAIVNCEVQDQAPKRCFNSIRRASRVMVQHLAMTCHRSYPVECLRIKKRAEGTMGKMV